MERDDQPKFEQQDSGAPVTTPDRNPDPLPPEHSVPEGAEGGSATGGGGSPAEHVREERGGRSDELEDEGGPAVPDRASGLEESNPAEGL